MFFSTFGKILSCKVKYDKFGKCKGYGYIQFETEAAAKKALAEAHLKEFKGTKIEVSVFKKPDFRDSSRTKYNNLYVKNIPKDYTDENLNKVFSKYGEIISAVVIKSTTVPTENKGFGFVCFKDYQDALKAEAMIKEKKPIQEQLTFPEFAFIVCRAIRKEDRISQIKIERLRIFKDRNLYVKELPEFVDDEKLKQAFSEFGNVISARVMLETTQNAESGKVEKKSRGFGFVCFSTTAEATRAKTEGPTKEIFGRKLEIYIPQRKEDRESRYTQKEFMPFPAQFPMNPYPFYPHPYPRQPKMRHVFKFLNNV